MCGMSYRYVPLLATSPPADDADFLTATCVSLRFDLDLDTTQNLRDPLGLESLWVNRNLENNGGFETLWVILLLHAGYTMAGLPQTVC